MRRVIAAVICLLASTALAQGGFSEVPKMFGTFEPKAGSWAEYDITQADGSKTHMRMAIVGVEGDAFWYEVVNSEADSRNIIKMLVMGNPNDPENIKRLILKSGEEPAREMPMDFVKMGRKMATHMFEQRSGVPADAAGKVKVEDLGEKTVTVPAGKYTGLEKRITDESGKELATYIFDEKILPFGIITSKSNEATMNLTGHGTDAKSKITEKPMKMETPPGMPANMPRGIPPGMGK